MNGPDFLAQIEERDFAADLSPNGCLLGFEGDLMCDRALIPTLLGASRARIAASQALLELRRFF